MRILNPHIIIAQQGYTMYLATTQLASGLEATMRALMVGLAICLAILTGCRGQRLCNNCATPKAVKAKVAPVSTDITFRAPEPPDDCPDGLCPIR